VKLTPWYPKKITPVREGLYTVRIHKSNQYSLWNGRKWSWFAPDKGMTLHYANSGLFHASLFRWRGLANSPDAAGGEK